MNKKFSTLVAAILAAGAWTTANAVDVTPEQFSNAISEKVLSIDVLKTALGDKWDSKIELTGNVDLSESKYVVIKGDEGKDIVLTAAKDKEVTFTGRIVIGTEGVTVSNLKIVNNPVNEDANGYWTKTAITAFANKVTITGNTISVGESATEGALANGVVLYPQSENVEWTVSGNTFEGLNNVVDEWYSSAIQVYQGTAGEVKVGDPLADTELLGVNVESGDADNATPVIKKGLNAAALASGNTFKKCAADVFVRNNVELAEGASTEAAYVSNPEDADQNDAVKAALLDAIKSIVKDGSINFDGTAEEFAALITSDELADVENSTSVFVTTKDGAVTPGLTLLEEKLTIGSEEGDPEVALAASYVDGEYYYLVVKTEDASKLLSTDENKGLVAEANTDVTEISDNYLWKVKSATSNKHDHIDYVFVNKAGVELELCSANKAAYDKKGVALVVSEELSALDGLSADEVLYFGLYRQPSHLVNVEDMNALHNGGFYVSFKDVAGTDAFNGLLKAEGAVGAEEFVLKNEDGSYIIAKATNVQGSNVNEYVYAFELTDKVAEASSFRFWHTPINVEDNHALLTKIDSIQVLVPTKESGVKAWATLGTYGLTTDNTKTLGASLETELDPVSINLADYTVKPEEFLKNGFAVIKLLAENEDDTDLFVVATGCGEKKITLAESVVNDLEKQWAISYDPEKKVYTMKNRENLEAAVIEIPYTKLRENGDKEDNIYLYAGQEYEITFVPVDESSNYYKYLSVDAADLEEKSFVMSYWSTVFNGYANVAINDKDWAFIDTKVEQTEFTAAAVDTVKAKSLINYYDADKKEWKKNEPVLKAPVYEFNVGELEFGLNNNGKFALLEDGATQMAIRVAGEHFNLAKVEESAWDGKVYVGNNDSYMYAVNCLYDDNKNTLFVVADNNRPEYRRLGATVKDGYNDMEGDLNILKFFRTNDENQFLYENTMNRNAQNGDACLNFLGETNLADQPAKSQLPFLVDTAFIRNETRKPLYLLSVRNEFVKGKEAVACPDHGFDPNCPHWTAGTPDHRTGAYLVALDDSVATYAQAKYQGNVRLAFVDATHVGDSLIIASSKYTGKKKDAAKDTLSFVTNKGAQKMNAATFAFKLVDRAVDPEGDKAAFFIEAVPATEGGTARYVRVHNTVPVLVSNLDEAAKFEVMAAAEGETATSNESIATEGVKVIAGNGVVTVKGAEGKNVVITNVLGQTIANTVVSSDEATIATPAGVVVVAVEGEAAVKAIVK